MFVSYHLLSLQLHCWNVNEDCLQIFERQSLHYRLEKENHLLYWSHDLWPEEYYQEMECLKSKAGQRK